MKRAGLLLTLILIARITSAQTEEVFPQRTEQTDILNMPKKDLGSINNPSETSTDKKPMISSAARKLSLYHESKLENDIEKNEIAVRYNSTQARKPVIAGRAPKVALPVVPHPVITKPRRMIMPVGRPIPSIGKLRI